MSAPARILVRLVLLVVCASAGATDITVTRFDDPTPVGCSPDDCSLREAIILAHAFSDADRILLDAGTSTLSIIDADEDAAEGGDLDIAND